MNTILVLLALIAGPERYPERFPDTSSLHPAGAQLHLLDNVKLTWGNTRTDPDVWMDNNGTTFCFTTTSVDGATGTDGDIWCYSLTGNVITFTSNLAVGGQSTTYITADANSMNFYEGGNAAIELYEDGGGVALNSLTGTVFNIKNSDSSGVVGIGSNSITLGASDVLEFGAGTILNGSTDGKLIVTNQANTTNVCLDASTDAAMWVYDGDCSGAATLTAGTLSVAAGVSVTQTSGGWGFQGVGGNVILAKLAADDATNGGSLLRLQQGGADYEFTASSGNQYGIQGQILEVNQTGTAAFHAIYFDITDGGSNTGQDYLLNLNWAGSPMFQVEDDGDAQLAGLLVTDDLLVTRQFLTESFVLSTVLYAGEWDVTNVVGAGTNVADGASLGGAALLTTGGAGGPDYESSWSNGAYWTRALAPRVDTKLTLTTDLVDKEVRFGYCDTPGDGTGCTDYAFIVFDESVHATHWYYSCGDAADATLGVGPTADVAERLRIDIDAAGEAKFWVDGVLEATVAGCVGADTAMYLFWSIKEEAALAEALSVNKITSSWD